MFIMTAMVIDTRISVSIGALIAMPVTSGFPSHCKTTYFWDIRTLAIPAHASPKRWRCLWKHRGTSIHSPKHVKIRPCPPPPFTTKWTLVGPRGLQRDKRRSTSSIMLDKLVRVQNLCSFVICLPANASHLGPHRRHLRCLTSMPHHRKNRRPPRRDSSPPRRYPPNRSQIDPVWGRLERDSPECRQ